MKAASTLTLACICLAFATCACAEDGLYGDLNKPGDVCDDSVAAACAFKPGLFNFGGINTPGTLLQVPLPVPAETLAASPPIDPAVGFATQQLTPTTHAVFDGVYVVVFVITDTGVLLIDAPGSMGEIIPAAVTSITDVPITHIVYSHQHTDHIGGAGAVVAASPPGVEIISSEAVKDLLIMRDDPARPLPTTTYSTPNATFDIGGVAVEMRTFEDAHDKAGNIIYLPELKLLFVVDIMYPDWVPFRSFALTVDINAYLELHYELLEYDIEILVCGHLTSVGDKSDIEVAIEYVESVKAAAAAGLAADVGPKLFELAGDYITNTWVTASLANQLQAEVCYAIIVEQWGGKLGGVDVYGRSHCVTWMDFLSLEAGPKEAAL